MEPRADRKEAPTGLEDGTRLGPYEIVAPIGAGGMGEVYRARDTRLGRDVAIKVLPARFTDDPDRLRRFEREARAVAALDHPNILAIHDVGTEDGSPYFVAELLEGESLRTCLRRGKLAPHRAVELAVQIARGLAAAHEKGFIHRDLKPENVFLAANGVVKILDFGLAKLVQPEVDPGAPTALSLEATEEGAVAGTQGYMSPEQVRGLTLDQRTDIFSFGCVLYEMLSGRRAFLRDNAADTTSAVLHDEPATLPAVVPGPLGKIVDRCLEKRREDRFSSAHDLALALQVVQAGRPGVVPRLRASAWPRRWRWVAIGSVVVALASLGLWRLATAREAPLPGFHPVRIAGPLGSVPDASVSPDGTVVAYTVQQGGTSDVWVTDVHGGKAIRLTDGTSLCSDPTWFPDGDAVSYVCSSGGGRSVWRIPRFGGTPMLVVPDAQDPAISPTGKQVAFARRGPEGVLRLWVAEVGNPTGPRRLTGGGVGVWDHRYPVWSPDGRMICFQDKRNLWLVPAAGGQARPLTRGDAEDSHAVWSPDQSHVYFVSVRNGVQGLWRVAVAGGEPTQVTHGTGSEGSPTISRDGRRLVFVAGPEIGTTALVDMRTGRTSTLRAGRNAIFPTIAPDRSAVAFESDLGGYSDLWLQPLRDNSPSGEMVRLTDHPGTCAVPAFSPDGRWIAYFRVEGGKRDVYVIPAHGGTPVNFTNRGGINIEPAWSPDGRQLAFVSDRGGKEQVWVAPISEGRCTGEARRVSDEDGEASYPSWSPDGASIAYVLTTGTTGEIRIVALEARRAARAVTRGAQAFMVRWWWSKNVLLVSGRWGERLPSIRMLPTSGGGGEQLVIPAGVALDPEYPEFEWSRDGALLALFQRTREAELWALEAEDGTF